MARILDIVKELFTEEEKEQDGFRCFYNINCSILRTDGQIEADKSITPAIQPAPPPAEMEAGGEPGTTTVATESVNRRGRKKLLTEAENFSFREDGIITFKKSESDNIHSLEDLIASISNHKNNEGNKTIPEEVAAILKIVISDQRNRMSEFLKTEDKILCTLDYGPKKEESIGFKANKLSGSDNMSILMRKNGSNLPDTFSPDLINTYIISMKEDE